MTMSEQVLSVIPGATEHQRLVIVHRSIEVRGSLQVFDGEQPETTSAIETPDVAALLARTERPFCEQLQSLRDRPIVLRQETFSPAVGWFTQSEMDLTMQQWDLMRATMVPAGRVSSHASAAPRPKTSSRRPVPKARQQRLVTPEWTAEGELVSFAILRDEAVPA